VETEAERPTSSDILADQFVVEVPDERSSIEKLQDQYEAEQGQKILTSEDLLEAEKKEEEGVRRQIEDDAIREQEIAKRRREELEELDLFPLPELHPKLQDSQDSHSVTMESVNEEGEDQWEDQEEKETTKEETKVELQPPEEEKKEEPKCWETVLEDSVTDKTDTYEPDETFPGFAKSDDSDEIQFKQQEPEPDPPEPSAEVRYVDLPEDEIRGPNYCENIIIAEGDLFESTEALGHAISADIRMGAGIAYDFKQEFGGMQELFMQKILPGGVAILERDVEIDGVWDKRFIYNLVTKTRYHDKPQLYVLSACLYEMRQHAREHGVKMICLPRIGAGLDQLKWADVYAAIAEVFGDTEIRIRIFLLPRKTVRKLEKIHIQEALWDEGLWHCEGEPQVLLQFASWD
jgi:O-acetyl-ADP-ribose deacetylase (regulator of RNase III)